LQEAAASFHSDLRVQELCNAISAAAALYLSLQKTASMGRGYAARREIPEGTDVCYYSGTIPSGWPPPGLNTSSTWE